MSLLATLAPLVGNIVSDVTGKLLPDRQAQAEVERQVLLGLLAHEQQMTEAAKTVLLAEIQGESWLQRNWRPLTMLVFVALIVAHWLGLTPQTLGDQEVAKVLDIVQLGLGGYVVGRSAEKIVSTWKGSR